MDAFSPIPALIGGALIGLASAVLWIGNGRLAGISGMFGELARPTRAAMWRLTFLGAMVFAGVAMSHLRPGGGVGSAAPAPQLVGGPIWLAVAGMLVGLGTKIGNGCTSGHGVCGIARLSVRSVVAVAVFFSVAIATVAVTGVV